MLSPTSGAGPEAGAPLAGRGENAQDSRVHNGGEQAVRAWLHLVHPFSRFGEAALLPRNLTLVHHERY
jgi:hypothetical protein